VQSELRSVSQHPRLPRRHRLQHRLPTKNQVVEITQRIKKLGVWKWSYPHAHAGLDSGPREPYFAVSDDRDSSGSRGPPGRSVTARHAGWVVTEGQGRRPSDAPGAHPR
jgi:hypothetical protein